MEKLEKIIERLEYCAETRDGFVRACINDALALLKERKAVEPSTDHHLFICPVCKTTLKREQKFCHECGKPIEWEGSVK